MKRIRLLGSTGSIGKSALAVVARHPNLFRVVGISAHRDADALAGQEAQLRSPEVVLSDPESDRDGHHKGWRRGREALIEMAAAPGADIVLNALVGAAGLEPTLAALEAGHTVALANKESLVAGGELVLEAARRGGGRIIPVDSEHSAILQCMEGRSPASVASLTLTASGGSLRDRAPASVASATVGEVLEHPTWSMGAKITVDSATLANKALEVIEAHFLYQVPYDSLRAVIHPQSIVHSFVEFVDGSVLAQLGPPNMEAPILYALGYPDRVPDPVLRGFDPVDATPLTFEEIGTDAYPMFELGRAAGEAGGSAPATYNAANEVAVHSFLAGALSFGGIAGVVESTLHVLGTKRAESLEEVLASDGEARRVAQERVNQMINSEK